VCQSLTPCGIRASASTASLTSSVSSGGRLAASNSSATSFDIGGIVAGDGDQPIGEALGLKPIGVAGRRAFKDGDMRAAARYGMRSQLNPAPVCSKHRPREPRLYEGTRTRDDTVEQPTAEGITEPPAPPP
jgi:hypothetical protein